MIDHSILYKTDAIESRVESLAKEISDKLNNMGGDVTFVVVLKGGFRFAADILNMLSIDARRIRIEFMRVEAYASAGVKRDRIRLTTLRDAIEAFTQRNVVILDDLFDSGSTLSCLRRYISSFAPLSIQEAVMLLRHVPDDYAIAKPTWRGFDLPSGLWVYGYGMDAHHEDKRTLSCIAARRT